MGVTDTHMHPRFSREGARACSRDWWCVGCLTCGIDVCRVHDGVLVSVRFVDSNNHSEEEAMQSRQRLLHPPVCATGV
jgi:hypothetical protein